MITFFVAIAGPFSALRESCKFAVSCSPVFTGAKASFTASFHWWTCLSFWLYKFYPLFVKLIKSSIPCAEEVAATGAKMFSPLKLYCQCSGIDFKMNIRMWIHSTSLCKPLRRDFLTSFTDILPANTPDFADLNCYISIFIQLDLKNSNVWGRLVSTVKLFTCPSKIINLKSLPHLLLTLVYGFVLNCIQ